MAEPWSRVANTTIQQYIKGAEDNIMRNRIILAMMREKGRISFNHGGTKLNWKIKFKRAPVQGYADGDTLTFSRHDRWKEAILDWRGYNAQDSVTKMERLQNKGPEQIVNLYSELTVSLMDDMEENFADELYVDGNATGNSKRIHGLESFFGNSGAGTKSPIAKPSDTYAGLSTVLGNYGGSWTSTGSTADSGVGDWPSGQGDAHYDFFSPLIVDYTSAVATSAAAGTNGWAATTKTWPNTCKEALRYGIIKGKRNKSKKGALDLILLDGELYRQFETKLDDAERLMVRRGDKKGGTYALGFEDTINFDGCDISWEYGVPVTLGYGWSFGNMELRSLQGQLFVPETPDYDIASKSERFSIDFFGNLQCNPRNFVKFMARS